MGTSCRRCRLTVNDTPAKLFYAGSSAIQRADHAGGIGISNVFSDLFGTVQGGCSSNPIKLYFDGRTRYPQHNRNVRRQPALRA